MKNAYYLLLAAMLAGTAISTVASAHVGVGVNPTGPCDDTNTMQVGNDPPPPIEHAHVCVSATNPVACIVTDDSPPVLANYTIGVAPNSGCPDVFNS